MKYDQDQGASKFLFIVLLILIPYFLAFDFNIEAGLRYAFDSNVEVIMFVQRVMGW